eukprot:UN0231
MVFPMPICYLQHTGLHFFHLLLGLLLLSLLFWSCSFSFSIFFFLFLELLFGDIICIL